MEDAAVEDTEMSGAAELAPAPVAPRPFDHSITVARPPPARRLDESCPPRELTAEDAARTMACSSSSSGKALMPEAPPEEPAPAPTQAAKKKEKKTKKVKMPRSWLEPLMNMEKWEKWDEEWLKALASLIPNGEQFLADRGFSLETYRELNSMDIVVKARTDMVAALREHLQEKGYFEIEVTDDEEDVEEEGRIVPVGRRRFRPGVCKKPDGRIYRLG